MADVGNAVTIGEQSDAENVGVTVDGTPSEQAGNLRPTSFCRVVKKFAPTPLLLQCWPSFGLILYRKGQNNHS